MYWIYLILFILAVLVPDLIQEDFNLLSETRAEELLIFLLGMAGFLIFVFKEHQLLIQKKDAEKNAKKLFRTTKDLTESYGYIGEVNRKMEILMQIGLGLSDKTELTRAKEKETYSAIINAASALFKAKNACLRFVNIKNNRTQKEVSVSKICRLIKNEELNELGEKINIKKDKDYLAVSSVKEINDIRCYLIIENYDETSVDANNQEILKFLVSQSLFLYSYMSKSGNGNGNKDK